MSYRYYFIWSKKGQGQLTLSIRNDEIFISRFIGHGFVCHCLEILCSIWHFRGQSVDIGEMFSWWSLPSGEVKAGSLALLSPSERSRQQAAVIQLCLVPRLYTVQYSTGRQHTHWKVLRQLDISARGWPLGTSSVHWFRFDNLMQ